MTCDQVLQLLPDHAMGTLSETEEASIRRHLRGCGACRADAVALDRGVAMFASAAHVAEPPPELRERVMTALAEEWADAGRPADAAAGPRGRATVPSRLGVRRWLAVAAVVAALGGAIAWGSVQHVQLASARGDQRSYRSFLHALGGREVRVAKLHAAGGVAVSGTAILYDSDQHESWALVELNSPGYRRPLTVRLVSSSGETLTLPFPVEIDADGHGAGWLVTAADITNFRTVRIVAPDGQVLATGVTGPED